MFKIGEFSKLTQVSIRMLRHYDEIGLLKPAKVDTFTGYRMYSADQIPMLQKIVLLKDSKFKLEEIKSIIMHNTEVNIIDELQEKKNQIIKEIEIEKQRINKIDNAINEITHIDYDNGRIYITYIDAMNNSSILDIKPYTPSIDRVENPNVPNWCSHWPLSYEKSGDFNWEDEFLFYYD